MANKEGVFTIRYIDESGNEQESAEVEYQYFRLSYRKKKTLLRKIDMTRFLSIDPDSIGAGKKPKLDNVDLSEMIAAEEDVFEELTILLFGLDSNRIDAIVLEDMETLIDYVKDKDPLKIKESRADAKKKAMQLMDSSTSAEKPTS